MNFGNAVFMKSAAGPEQFIHDARSQVVFAGRSNVGKSSVINTLTGRKNLARVGNTPGKTTHVNYFLIDEKFMLVDLPGYGYSKRSDAEKRRWADLMEAYFQQYDVITLGVLVVDIRHEPTVLDRQMAAYFQQTCVPWLVLANKADKLKAREIEGSLEAIKKTLVLDDSVALIPFSAEKGLGKAGLAAEIALRVI